LKPAPENSLQNPISKKTHHKKRKKKKKERKTHHKKRAGGVAQGVCPGYKPQYHEKKVKFP
jgi:hypothetical protein